MSERVGEFETARAQRVIRGLERPPVEFVVNLGVPLDFETGVIRCPDCGIDAISVIDARSFPAGSYPEHAVILLGCRVCGCQFGVGVDAEEGQAILRTTRMR